MVRKRKKKEEEQKPWCFYCDREFQDEQTLITHQRNKHFKCEICVKKLTTAKALAVHSLQVHKVTVHKVPAAKDGRDSPEWDIFGMAGVPPGMKPGDPVPKGSKQNGAAQAVEAVPDATATTRSAAPVAPAAPGPAAQYGMPQYGAPQPYGYPPAPYGMPAPPMGMPYGRPPGMPPPGMMGPPPMMGPPRPGMQLPPGVGGPASMSQPRPAGGPLFPAASGPTQAGALFPAAANTGTTPSAQPGSMSHLVHASGNQPALGQQQEQQRPAGVQQFAVPTAGGLTAAAFAPPTDDRPAATAASLGPDVALVWADDDFSPEERRARLSKYNKKVAPSAPSLTQQVAAVTAPPPQQPIPAQHMAGAQQMQLPAVQPTPQHTTAQQGQQPGVSAQQVQHGTPSSQVSQFQQGRPPMQQPGQPRLQQASAPPMAGQQRPPGASMSQPPPSLPQQVPHPGQFGSPPMHTQHQQFSQQSLQPYQQRPPMGGFVPGGAGPPPGYRPPPTSMAQPGYVPGSGAPSPQMRPPWGVPPQRPPF